MMDTFIYIILLSLIILFPFAIIKICEVFKGIKKGGNKMKFDLKELTREVRGLTEEVQDLTDRIKNFNEEMER
ncbi:MAG: hypothetical protein E6929_11655 [Clostridium sp.]|nr:hypothetical protein [Clostridium sp.]